MKQIYLLFYLVSFCLFSQAPEKMSYQLVVRNSAGVLASQGVGVKISILSGSASGTAVYVETHNSATTNANGLLSVNIGEGTQTSTENFSDINWSADTYFIKTEIDPTTLGGIAYTITGTSQLLSVPYALHAKTTDQSDEITLATSAIAALASRIEALDSAAPSLGDYKHGGVVFYIFQPGDSGYVSGEDHGLVCAIANQGSTNFWGCSGTLIAGVEQDGNSLSGSDVITNVGDMKGKSSTAAILAGCSERPIAASLASSYRGGGYDDWYLPSAGELNEMYKKRATINRTATDNGGSSFGSHDYYWSATQHSLGITWGQYFRNGMQQRFPKGSPVISASSFVRAVRAF